MPDHDRLLRRAEVEQRCGLTRSTIYPLMAENRFPRSIQVGPRAVRWSLLELEEWLATRPRTVGEGSHGHDNRGRPPRPAPRRIRGHRKHVQ